MADGDDPEVAALLDALRRLTTLADRLLEHATGQPLTVDQARDARHELESTRAGIDRLDELLTLRRQHLRPM